MEQPESLEKRIDHLEEEARMVLPGLQALFGFQLIAAFNQRFNELSPRLQYLHFSAMILCAIAILLVLTPAAYHRQALPGRISTRLCDIGTVCLSVGMFPMALSTNLDIYVIAKLIFPSDTIPALSAALLFSAFVIAWFIFPILSRLCLNHDDI